MWKHSTFFKLQLRKRLIWERKTPPPTTTTTRRRLQRLDWFLAGTEAPEASAGHPNKNSIVSAHVWMGREKRREPCLSSSLPLPIVPCALSYPYPVFLRRKKVSARGESTEAGSKRPLQTKFCYPANYLNLFQTKQRLWKTCAQMTKFRIRNMFDVSMYHRIIIKSEKC